jgi:hypothetical protein
MKEFIQGIIRSNIDEIKLVVQGVLMLLIKNTVAKMLLLPQVMHSKLPTKKKGVELPKNSSTKSFGGQGRMENVHSQCRNPTLRQV